MARARRPLAAPARSFSRRRSAECSADLLRGGSFRMTNEGGRRRCERTNALTHKARGACQPGRRPSFRLTGGCCGGRRPCRRSRCPGCGRASGGGPRCRGRGCRPAAPAWCCRRTFSIRSARYWKPMFRFVSVSRRSLRVVPGFSQRAVAGISCVRPMAPTWLVAAVLNPLSVFTSPNATSGLIPFSRAASWICSASRSDTLKPLLRYFSASFFASAEGSSSRAFSSTASSASFSRRLCSITFTGTMASWIACCIVTVFAASGALSRPRITAPSTIAPRTRRTCTGREVRSARVSLRKRDRWLTRGARLDSLPFITNVSSFRTIGGARSYMSQRCISAFLLCSNDNPRMGLGQPRGRICSVI